MTAASGHRSQWADVALVAGQPAGWLWLAALYPALLTALVLGACLALHRLMLASGGSWLFSAPWLSTAWFHSRDTSSPMAQEARPSQL